MWILGGESSSTASHEDDVESQSSSDGEELFSTDVSDTQLGGVHSSDSEGFSMDVCDTKRKRPRARVQGAWA